MEASLQFEKRKISQIKPDPSQCLWTGKDTFPKSAPSCIQPGYTVRSLLYCWSVAWEICLLESALPVNPWHAWQPGPWQPVALNSHDFYNATTRRRPLSIIGLIKICLVHPFPVYKGRLPTSLPIDASLLLMVLIFVELRGTCLGFDIALSETVGSLKAQIQTVNGESIGMDD